MCPRILVTFALHSFTTKLSELYPQNFIHLPFKEMYLDNQIPLKLTSSLLFCKVYLGFRIPLIKSM